jgi:hypothetical protein
MSQGKYFGRLKGYSLITLKKSRPMAQDIMASIQGWSSSEKNKNIPNDFEKHMAISNCLL